MLRDGEVLARSTVAPAESGRFIECGGRSCCGPSLTRRSSPSRTSACSANCRRRTVELTRSVEQLTALGEVGQAISSSLDLDTVLYHDRLRAVQLSGATAAWCSSTTRTTRVRPARPDRRRVRGLAEARRDQSNRRRAKECSAGPPSRWNRAKCPTSQCRAPTRVGCERQSDRVRHPRHLRRADASRRSVDRVSSLSPRNHPGDVPSRGDRSASHVAQPSLLSPSRMRGSFVRSRTRADSSRSPASTSPSSWPTCPTSCARR